MKITEKLLRQLEISEVPSLDPIRVTLEDIGPGQGRINIECYGQAWSAYWGGMGKETVAEFFTTCDEHYIAGKLASGLSSDVFDPDGLKDMLKREVIDERRRGGTKRQARKDWDAIEDADIPECENDLWAMSATMQALMGDEWWYRLPQRPNPDYLYLCRIIKAVQEALRGSVAVEGAKVEVLLPNGEKREVAGHEVPVVNESLASALAAVAEQRDDLLTALKLAEGVAQRVIAMTGFDESQIADWRPQVRAAIASVKGGAA